MKSIFTQNQIQFIVDNYKTMSYRKIANELGFTERQIRGRINNMGLTKNRKIKSDYFKVIDNPNKAYWLGFIYADGSISANPDNHNYELSIEIHNNDRNHLCGFELELGCDDLIGQRQRTISFNGYTYRTDTAYLRVYSKQLVMDLLDKNVVPNKTYEREFPKCQDFFWDFVRGVFDGDGCISKNGNCVKITTSNIDFLNYLSFEIRKRIDATCYIYTEKEYKHSLVLRTRSDREKFLRAMYYDDHSFRLKRKYDLFLQLYGLPA